MGPAIAVPPDESSLVARAAVDPLAFAALYERYFPRVYNYVRYRVRDGPASDDITATVFELALSKLPSYRPARGPFAPWLFGIARNAVSLHFREARRRHWVPLENVRDQPSDGAGPEDCALLGEANAELLAAVERLGGRERDLVALKLGAGLTNRQIAALTGLKESNVAVILFRTLLRLRSALGGKG